MPRYFLWMHLFSFQLHWYFFLMHWYFFPHPLGLFPKMGYFPLHAPVSNVFYLKHLYMFVCFMLFLRITVLQSKMILKMQHY